MQLLQSNKPRVLLRLPLARKKTNEPKESESTEWLTAAPKKRKAPTNAKNRKVTSANAKKRPLKKAVKQRSEVIDLIDDDDEDEEEKSAAAARNDPLWSDDESENEFV